MDSPDFIEYAATATGTEGVYLYGLDDVMAVYQERAREAGSYVPLTEVYEISLAWARARNGHQNRRQAGKDGS